MSDAILGTIVVVGTAGGIIAVAVNAILAGRDAIAKRFAGNKMMLDKHEYHDDIKPLQEDAYGQWLDRARAAITKLSQERDGGVVSADDVWDICPPPPSVEPRAMGAIWQPRDRWQKVGYVQSRRHAINHRRPVMQWRYLSLDEMRRAAE